jgi:transposase
MTAANAFKRLTLRAVLRDVSPMVIRVVSMPDDTELTDLHEIFQTILGWSLDLGYAFRIHGKEFKSFRRRTRSQPLREFHLHRQEKFRYLADTLDLWEWEVRVLDLEDGVPDDRAPRCLAGRGAAPPEGCGGPRGYRLMLKYQQEGARVSDPALLDATVKWLAATHPEQPANTWDVLRDAVRDGWQSIDRRLEDSGPLHPERFRLREANERVAAHCVDRGVGDAHHAEMWRHRSWRVQRGEDPPRRRPPPGRARRWVVERTLSWLNRFRKLLVRFEKLRVSRLALLELACALIVLRQIIVIHG